LFRKTVSPDIRIATSRGLTWAAYIPVHSAPWTGVIAIIVRGTVVAAKGRIQQRDPVADV